jgi:hypothetical protein
MPFSFAAQRLYDQSYPGIQPLIDDSQTGPPVAPQYVVPTAPVTPAAGTVVHVGQALGGGQYASMPDDNMPASYITRAPDGTIVRKVIQSTPFGSASWYSAS